MNTSSFGKKLQLMFCCLLLLFLPQTAKARSSSPQAQPAPTTPQARPEQPTEALRVIRAPGADSASLSEKPSSAYHDWSGFYIGGTVGMRLGKKEKIRFSPEPRSFFDAPPQPDPVPEEDQDSSFRSKLLSAATSPSGFEFSYEETSNIYLMEGGHQFGYLYQKKSGFPLVFGCEAGVVNYGFNAFSFKDSLFAFDILGKFGISFNKYLVYSMFGVQMWLDNRDMNIKKFFLDAKVSTYKKAHPLFGIGIESIAAENKGKTLSFKAEYFYGSPFSVSLSGGEEKILPHRVRLGFNVHF